MSDASPGHGVEESEPPLTRELLPPGHDMGLIRGWIAMSAPAGGIVGFLQGSVYLVVFWTGFIMATWFAIFLVHDLSKGRYNIL
jgi:hypothetical protein